MEQMHLGFVSYIDCCFGSSEGLGQDLLSLLPGATKAKENRTAASGACEGNRRGW